MSELSERLRRAATVCEEWNRSLDPPLKDWSALMDEAADALEAEEEDEIPPSDEVVFRELTDSEQAAEDATWD